MRLIDADELYKGIEQQYCTACDNYNNIRCKACDVAECLRWVDDTPTIEAEPVKHGTWAAKKPSRMKWILDENDDITEEETTIEDMIEQKCSICQRWSIKFAYHIEMNFCPKCGARMDGDNDD